MQNTGALKIQITMERFTCKMYVIVLMSRTDKHQTSILGGF